jgi:predicted  nucleic acid-binding Zn-ribbon protein
MTPQMEKFCQGIADGLSQADAYRMAYPKSKSWKPETLHPQASKMMADHKIATRVQELKEQLASKALWTRQDSVRALENAMQMAKDRENAAWLVAAVKELNAMHGYNEAIKHEITAKVSTIDPAKLSPQAMRELLAARAR